MGVLCKRLRLICLPLAGFLLLAGCATVPPSTQAVGTSQPSQTIELYDASGRHIGYGKVQGGSIELFNPDSSRAGSGRIGR